MQCLQQTPLLSLSLEVYFLSVFHVSAQKNIINTILTGAKYFRCQHYPYSSITWSLWPPCWRVFSQGSFSCLTLLWRIRLLYSIHELSTMKQISKEVQVNSIPANSHALGVSLTPAGQFLTPDWKMWVVAVLLDTISKNMLTQTHVRNENHV